MKLIASLTIVLLGTAAAVAQGTGTGITPPGGGGTAPPPTCTIEQKVCTPASPYGFPGTCTTTIIPCPVTPPPPCTKPDPKGTGLLVPC